MSELEPTSLPPGELLADIRALIAEARRQTTVAVNMGLTLLDWRIGQRIHREVLGSERAAYGEQIVVTESRQLVVDYGPGLFREEPPPNGSVCRAVSRAGDCRDAVTTIELVPLQRPFAPQSALPTSRVSAFAYPFASTRAPTGRSGRGIQDDLGSWIWIAFGARLLLLAGVC